MPDPRQVAQIRFDTKPAQGLLSGDRFALAENRDVAFTGLDPGSPVEVRLEGDADFRVRLHADSRGAVQSRDNQDLVPQQLGIAMRGGEAFEVRCTVDGAPLVFVLEVEHNRFTAEEISAMLADLGAMDLQWDATSPIPTRVGDLEQRITRFVTNYPALASTARSIFMHPDEVLERTQRLVPVRSLKRLNPSNLRSNLVQRRLDASGRPLSKELIDTVDIASIDTPANAYVSMLVNSLAHYRDGLERQIDLEDRRLATEANRERSYRSTVAPIGPAERKALELRQRLKQLRENLRAVSPINLPREWRSFQSRPDRTANAVRFDARFTKFTRLASDIMDWRAETARADRLQRIAEFGRRPHDEIYEVWTVCKTFEALYRLGFRTPRNPDSTDHLEAFVQLEKPSGSLYGLRENEAVTLVHKDAPHLLIRIGYEPRVSYHRGGVRTPDIMLVLRGKDVSEKRRAQFGGRAYGNSPLFLDAKYQARSILDRDPDSRRKFITKYVDLAAKGRHPHSYVLQAARGKFAWAQRKLFGEMESAWELGISSHALFPYRVGIATMEPSPQKADSSLEARLPIVRIIYAWLVMQGVICVCPRCGGALSKRAGTSRLDQATGLCADTFKPYLPDSDSVIPNPPRRTLECRECELGITANYCGSCRAQQVFVPIIKVYPRKGSEYDKQSTDWVRDYEIAEPSDVHWGRHCPKCGAAP